MTSIDPGFRIGAVADANSLSGYEQGVRHQIPSDRSDDLHWVVNLQTRAASDQLRLRHVEYDNAPAGRPVHWSSAYSWWVQALAKIHKTVTGENEALSIERAALYANVLLCSLALILLSASVARVFGALPSAGVAVAFLALLPFRDVFKFGIGDHHAAAIICSLLCVFFLLFALELGLSERREWKGARSCAILSAVFGAIGLWINVVSQIPLLIGLHSAGLLGLLLLAHDSEASTRLSKLWRIWGWCGGAAGTLAYLIEYAPFHLSMRLEVNHPLYALAWIGGGELLYQLYRWRGGGSVAWVPSLLSAVSILQLPLIVMLARERFFQVADPFLLAIHDRYIMEFQSLAANLAVLPSHTRNIVMLLPFALIAVSCVLLLGRKLSLRQRFLILAALGPVVCLFLLTLHQARWWSHSSALLIPLVVLLLAVSRRWSPWFRTTLSATTFLLLAPGALVTALGTFQEEAPRRKEVLRVAEKGIAHYLRARVGEGQWLALASPDATTNLIYYGGAKGVGTFYWENNEGLKRAAAMFASKDVEETKRRIMDAGVTHVVIYSWGGFEKEYLELYSDFLAAAEPPAGTPFLLRLVGERSVPRWLRSVPYRLPSHAEYEQEVPLLYEVVEEMDPGLALAREFEYLLEMGITSAAFALQKQLERHASDGAASVSLARLYALSGQEAAFARQVESLLAASWESLDAENRVRLSGVLAVSGRLERARAELVAALGDLSEAELRSFNSDAVMHLLELSRALDVAFKSARLEALAKELLPSRLRGRLGG